MKPKPTAMFDFIGDIHGDYKSLVALLKKLGYSKADGVWQHPNRKAVFCGDFINRGKEIKKTVTLIKTMHENQKALVVLGNHEWSAIVYQSFQKGDETLPLSVKKIIPQIRNTRREFKSYPGEWKQVVKWLRTLPFYLELENVRAIHACWDNNAIAKISKWRGNKVKMKKKEIRALFSSQNPNVLKAIERVTRGQIFTLPTDLYMKCNKGISRRSFRMNWWKKPENPTFREFAFGNKFNLPNYTVPKQIRPKSLSYESTEPPVFFGHYCLGKGARIVQSNLACVDSCIAATGVASAYRWNGEQELSSENFITSS